MSFSIKVVPNNFSNLKVATICYGDDEQNEIVLTPIVGWAVSIAPEREIDNIR